MHHKKRSRTGGPKTSTPTTTDALRSEYGPQLPPTVRELSCDQDSWVLVDDSSGGLLVSIDRLGSFWFVSIDDGRIGVEVIDTDPTLGEFLRALGRSPMRERTSFLNGRELDVAIEFGSGQLLGIPELTRLDRLIESRPGFVAASFPLGPRE